MRTAYTIKCPACDTGQTGIIKFSTGTVRLVPCAEVGYHHTSHAFNAGQTLKKGMPYIRCAIIWCQHLIIEKELDDVLTPVVKFPADYLKELKRG